ncbi:MAG: hypothetical protein M1826_002890 [Phylliscum demangeonii]|nr:MAG: hypothetical protein M1826_002890 [Phylliscum demangeonii]
MKLLSSVLVLALATELAVASNWFSRAAYNSWHQTELERWLSDNDIPYASPADRKDLEEVIKKNWNSKVSTPYTGWDVKQLQSYLKERGHEIAENSDQTQEGLVAQVKSYWYETEDQAQDAWTSVKTWIFDSWTDSQLKSFLDRHGIPAPQPRKRDNLLAAVRNNYDSAAKKAGETASYPGNWLYESWSESDLKAWLDERGIPAPQPTSRDRLIASVRRNARLAVLSGQGIGASATSAVKGAASAGSSAVKGAASSASSAVSGAASAVSSAVGSTADTVNDAVFDTWSDSRIKEWADKNGIKVPQGTTRNELLALARKNRAYLTEDDVSGKVANAFGAATSKVASEAAKATDTVKETVVDLFNSAIGTWSDSRLKAYLDARGVPVPQSGKRDELIAAVRLNRHKAATGGSAWTFDTWTVENLRTWLSTNGDKAAKKASAKAGATREELVKQAQDSYAAASKTGGKGYASMTSAIAAATDYAKDTTFGTWTDSDLKAYLDGYGIPVPQGTKTEELKALARRQSTYFRYGTSSPSGTLLARLQEGAQWVLEQLKIGAASGRKEVEYQGEKAYDRVKEEATKATHRAGEAAQRAKHRVKEEL